MAGQRVLGARWAGKEGRGARGACGSGRGVVVAKGAEGGRPWDRSRGHTFFLLSNGARLLRSGCVCARRGGRLRWRARFSSTFVMALRYDTATGRGLHVVQAADPGLGLLPALRRGKNAGSLRLPPPQPPPRPPRPPTTTATATPVPTHLLLPICPGMPPNPPTDYSAMIPPTRPHPPTRPLTRAAAHRPRHVLRALPGGGAPLPPRARGRGPAGPAHRQAQRLRQRAQRLRPVRWSRAARARSPRFPALSFLALPSLSFSRLFFHFSPLLRSHAHPP